MLKNLRVLVLFLLAGLVFNSVCYAGTLNNIKAWFSGEVVSMIVSCVAVILGSVFGMMFVKVAKTFKETGDFLAALGNALEDKKITREELAAIVKEGKEVYHIWR